MFQRIVAVCIIVAAAVYVVACIVWPIIGAFA
jgi:hypothetical protein